MKGIKINQTIVNLDQTLCVKPYVEPRKDGHQTGTYTHLPVVRVTSISGHDVDIPIGSAYMPKKDALDYATRQLEAILREAREI